MSVVLLRKRVLVDVIKLKGHQRQSWSPVTDVFLNRGHLGKQSDIVEQQRQRLEWHVYKTGATKGC